MSERHSLAIPALTDEEIAIAIIQNAATAAFDPQKRFGVKRGEIVQTIAALDSFLEQAGNLPPRSFEDWRETIGNLRMKLGR